LERLLNVEDKPVMISLDNKLDALLKMLVLLDGMCAAANKKLRTTLVIPRDLVKMLVLVSTLPLCLDLDVDSVLLKEEPTLDVMVTHVHPTVLPTVSPEMTSLGVVPSLSMEKPNRLFLLPLVDHSTFSLETCAALFLDWTVDQMV
jgi:hypothetical protein